MKTMKKLGAIMLVMAMCLMLSTVVSADSVSLPEVACSATSDKANYCVSADTQQITVTVAPSVPTDMISLYANVLVPEGWSINSIQNAKLEEATNLPFADGYDSTTKQIQWFALKEVGGQLDIANCQTDVLAVITYNVPANAEGTFPLGLTDVEIYTDASGESNKFEFQEVKVNGNTELNVTIGEHDWEVTYTDTEGETHTANYVCKNDASHTKSDEPVAHTYDQEGDKCVCGVVKPVQPAGMKGDVDLDGDVDMDDLVAMAQHVGEVDEITDSQSFANADVDGDDEVVDMNDLVKLAQYIGEVIDSLD